MYGGGGCEGVAVAGAETESPCESVIGEGMQSSMLMSVIGLVQGVVMPVSIGEMSVVREVSVSVSSTS